MRRTSEENCGGKYRFVLSPSDAPPIHSAPYHAEPKQQKLEREEVASMNNAVVTKPAVAEWDLYSVFVPKKNGSLCFCAGYRQLSAVTVRHSYPIPRMDDRIDSSRKAKILPTLGANAGYWQVAMDEKDVHKTALATHNEL